ncbi:MAG: AzlC family ABC transporter permease [Chloroflexi bacterium]|nr:AzlC family ABC transporter permease [Dehalococcoidia bacterium]MCO5203299.1 AzlC family ABC transporter permease [Chloroflexota bacterium]PWB43857.1 MAG: branched-chain amino acid permease [Dehalococcoidia bacterium]
MPQARTRRSVEQGQGGGGFAYGLRASVPLCVAVGAFGVSFGVLARSNGFGLVAPIVMSLTAFTGASQFAVVAILGDGGGLGAAVTAAVLLAARYIPIGFSVAPVLRGPVLSRFFQSQLIIDESWAVANRGDGTFDRGALLGAGSAIYVSWVAGTALGVLGGDALGDPETLGLDAAFPALFLALLVPQIRSRTAVAAAIGGAVIAGVLIPVARPGIPIIVAALACLAGWRRK